MSAMIIHNCEQNTEAWLRCRMGMPTASEYKVVMAIGKGGAASETRDKYMARLCTEQIDDAPVATFENDDMVRGRVMEPEARMQYEERYRVAVECVGFIQNGNTGASPDGLIGKNGMLEIKTAFPHIVRFHRKRGGIPPAFRAQLQGALWVAEREWIDLFVYPTDLRNCEPYKERAYREERYIKEIAGEVARFNDELAALVAAERALLG